MTFRAQLNDKSKTYQMVSVHNALAAKIANSFGFDWISVGGYNVSGSWLGLPDVGLLTLSEQVEAVRKIAAVVDSPIVVDGDDGYGNYLNVMRLVREMEHAGANAMHIEDQVLPKRCGHMKGKKLVPQEDFISKIKAFVDTRKSDDFMLIARTDALAVNGLNEAIDRSNAYLEAGADVIFVEAIRSMEQAVKIPKQINGPLLYNWVFKGLSPLIPLDELCKLGYTYVLQADVLYPVAYALREYFGQLKATGSYGSCEDRMLSFDEFNTIIGLNEIIEAERKYELGQT